MRQFPWSNFYIFIVGKYKLEGSYGPPEEESSLDVSSPRDVNSPMVCSHAINSI
jgi:hypothetical protein